jgi:ABC-2 type transport system ATP-binding protein
VDEVEAFTGVVPIRDKTLKTLSKGMKQRVSLARALVHGPEVLIMDEPANGLDPRARIELRELVAVLAERGKTVLVSSHILTELAEMCGRVVIIERGRLVGDGTLDALADTGRSTLRVVVRALDMAPDALCRAVLQVPGVALARMQEDACLAEVSGGRAESAAVLAELVRQGVPVVEYRQERVDLEDVFMTVTKGDVA